MKHCQTKEEAYSSGNRALYKQATNKLSKEIRVAKRSYNEKFKKNYFSANDPASVWRDLQHILVTRVHPPSVKRILN